MTNVPDSTDSFDPKDPNTWIGRGRTPDHAAALAQAWRDFPDLEPHAPLVARMARSRERVAAMRPVNDAIRAHTEAQRQADNFGSSNGKAPPDRSTTAIWRSYALATATLTTGTMPSNTAEAGTRPTLGGSTDPVWTAGLAMLKR